ncbi:hypothetical protein [Microbulbifer agarilyticus]|uniref:hypothetical protein n=1 Tax=Microbulbifer agarilyticus TaxID=260552 RepID=UPI001CD56951|nr:hypothetical protein [Microbulbifer agarilyticus]MCA0899161.1 hypothetical protein [Microbulbifer agarilyticus]
MTKIVLISPIFTLLLGCIPSQDFSSRIGEADFVSACYTLAKPAFIFESDCANLSGGLSNVENCLSIQAVGEGGFPPSMERYSKRKGEIDETLFDPLVFDRKGSITGMVAAGTKLNISKVVHHGWGTYGNIWVVRAQLQLSNGTVEVEIPSFSWVHKEPLWLNGRDDYFSGFYEEYLAGCDE